MKFLPSRTIAAVLVVVGSAAPLPASAADIPLSSCSVVASTPIKSSQQVRGTVTITCSIPPGEPVYDADLAASRIKRNASYTGYATTSGSNSTWRLSATSSVSCGLSDASYTTNGYDRAKANQRTVTVNSPTVRISC